MYVAFSAIKSMKPFCIMELGLTFTEKEFVQEKGTKTKEFQNKNLLKMIIF